MSETTVAAKATPGRRRNGRGQGKAANPKAYASENNAGRTNPSRHDNAPQTPQKRSMQSSAQSNAPNSQANTKTRSRNKAKGANADSAEPSSAGHHITPQRAASMSSSKENMAFAGATFHASPAPSALPMPSLFQRASNESPVTHGKTQEPSPPATDTEAATPQRAVSVSKTTGSPLDFMFQAHREERERERRGSTLSQKPMTGGAFSPVQSPGEHQNMRGSYSVPHGRAPLARNPSAGRVGSEELEGSNDLPMGPAFSTPYQDRIRAARTSQYSQNLAHAQSPSHQATRQSQQQTPTHGELEDKTEALKRFLNLGENGSPAKAQAAPKYTPQNFQQQSFQHQMPQSQYSSGFRPQPHHAAVPGNGGPISNGPGTPMAPSDVQAMENDLKRILKLNLGTNL